METRIQPPGEGLVKPKRQSSSLGCVRPRFPRTPRVLWGNLPAYARNLTQTRTNAVSLSAQHPNSETRIKTTHEFADNPTTTFTHAQFTHTQSSNLCSHPWTKIASTKANRQPSSANRSANRLWTGSRTVLLVDDTSSTYYSWTIKKILQINARYSGRSEKNSLCERAVKDRWTRNLSYLIV